MFCESEIMFVRYYGASSSAFSFSWVAVVFLEQRVNELCIVCSEYCINAELRGSVLMLSTLLRNEVGLSARQTIFLSNQMIERSPFAA